MNSIGKYSRDYESFGVKVILPGDPDGGNYGRINECSLYLFALLSLLVL